jgi:hypothetical protein
MVSAPVLMLPLAASAPTQPPPAVHEVAFVELQVNIEALPLEIAVGKAVNVTRGMILTMAVAGVLLPPGPVQLSEYEVGAVSAPVLMLPFAAWAPLQPPVAVQEVAFVEPQVNIEALPLAIETGMAARDAVGTRGVVDEPPPHAASGSNRIGRRSMHPSGRRRGRMFVLFKKIHPNPSARCATR